jgi:hypothetical protein
VQVTVGPLDTPPEGTPAGRVLEYRPRSCSSNGPGRSGPEQSFAGDDLAAIGRISRALDGIPLALELAGVRVATMSPVEIAGRLHHRFALLTTGARTAEARQQTLRATVDWSCDLRLHDASRERLGHLTQPPVTGSSSPARRLAVPSRTTWPTAKQRTATQRVTEEERSVVVVESAVHAHLDPYRATRMAPGGCHVSGV